MWSSTAGLASAWQPRLSAAWRMRPATRCRHIVDIVVDFNLETADNFGLKVRTGNGEETVIGYDVAASELYVDRTRSGNVSFSRDFPGVQRAPLTASDGEVRLRILVDWSSVEVFTDAGHRVITDQIFPSSTRGLSCSPKAARSWWTHSPSGNAVDLAIVGHRRRADTSPQTVWLSNQLRSRASRPAGVGELVCPGWVGADPLAGDGRDGGRELGGLGQQRAVG